MPAVRCPQKALLDQIIKLHIQGSLSFLHTAISSEESLGQELRTGLAIYINTSLYVAVNTEQDMWVILNLYILQSLP